MDDSQGPAQASQAFQNGEWNKYRVLAEGARIQTWVNGNQVSDLVDESSRPTPRDSLACKFMESGKDRAVQRCLAQRQGSRNSFQVNRAVPQDHESPGPFDSFLGDRLTCHGQAPQKQGWIRIPV